MFQAFFNKLLRCTIGHDSSTQITINGKTYVGKNIHIQNDKVYVDGTEQPGEFSEKVINVTIHGDCSYIEGVVNSITVAGDVHGDVSTVSGDVRCNDVHKDVETVSGDVHCRIIKGKVTTVSGDIG